MKKVLSFLTIFTVTVFSAYATHNRAGEITYRHISGLKYEVTITTYTKESSTAADRDKLEILWGDGNNSELPRDNGSGQTVGPDIKINIYKGTHDYPGPGRYILSMLDPNRNGGIQNMAGSVNIPFYIESELIISPFEVGRYNNSPVLLNPPIDNACVNRLYIHNPGATDPDGDSLSYEIINVRKAPGTVADGYYIPANVSIDAITGDLIWNMPAIIGEFNFAILIKEWRRKNNGSQVIGTVVRDLQVTVGPCNNFPPVIAPMKDTCIEAGTFLQYNIKATDPDNDNVSLNITGGPFIVSVSPAQFPQNVTNTGTVSADLTWQTECSHVRTSPYSVLVKAFDSPSNSSEPSLSDYKSFNIHVVGPSPKNPVATPTGNNIILNWDSSVCMEATGYKIYRKTGYYGFIPDHCELGVPAYTGYSYVATVEGHGTITYTDPNLIHGQQYCYMIVAEFPDGAESYASIEICAELKKDVPVITHVSVENTAETGQIYTAWSAPTEMDTLQNPGPYRYLIYRSPDMTGENWELIDSTVISQTIKETDTIYIDKLVNTVSHANSYKIELVNRGPGNFYSIGNTHTAASIWLEIEPVETGRALELKWDVNVPWTNYRYDIYKYDNGSASFDSIGTTTQTSYIDTGLTNLESYCYYVKAVGEYSADGITKPLINLSQEKCGVPNDIEPPCPPILAVEPDCEMVKNTLTFTLPEGTCHNDAIFYQIYFKEVLDGTFEKLKTMEGNVPVEFIHERPNTIAGCYYITSVDEYGNESLFVDSICVDNCPVYELPNVFSPDGDGINDFFQPFPYKFVESINLKILNRWGQQIFESSNPNINWNGLHLSSKAPCTEGVYYYICTVNEIRLTGIESRSLQGSIHLFRSADIIPQIKD